MWRRLFNLLVALSLLLFVAASLLWVQSHVSGRRILGRKAQSVGDSHYNWFVALESSAGGFQIAQDAEVYERAFITDAQAALANGRWEWLGRRDEPAVYPRPLFETGRIPRWGFWLAWQESHWVVRRELIAPYWFVALATAILPLLWLRRFNRRRARERRSALGLCVRCGYDLRASPGTCPECGAAA